MKDPKLSGGSDSYHERQAKTIRSRTNPPADLTGMRFGKWTVLKYAGQRLHYYRGHKYLTRIWLCRCDCGVQKEVPHHNLTGGHSKRCQQCFRTRGGMSSTKSTMLGETETKGKLAKEWQDLDAFRKDVGDPPAKGARLTRMIAPSHTLLGTPSGYIALLQHDPAFLQRLRKKSREERVAQDNMLQRIRNAKSSEERNRCMIAARKAGFSLD